MNTVNLTHPLCPLRPRRGLATPASASQRETTAGPTSAGLEPFTVLSLADARAASPPTAANRTDGAAKPADDNHRQRRQGPRLRLEPSLLAHHARARVTATRTTRHCT